MTDRKRFAAAVRAARQYIEAGASGAPCAHLASTLAHVVLGDTRAQLLALKVLEGGPFAHARATELAQMLIKRAQEVSQPDLPASDEDWSLDRALEELQRFRNDMLCNAEVSPQKNGVRAEQQFLLAIAELDAAECHMMLAVIDDRGEE